MVLITRFTGPRYSPNRECKSGPWLQAASYTSIGLIPTGAHGVRMIAPNGDYRLTVGINAIRVRSILNALMSDFMAIIVHLSSDAVMLNLAGEPVYAFEASAPYALGGFGSGQDSSRMNCLYEKFSGMIANEPHQKEEQ